MKKFEVTVTRTGSVIVEAESETQAFDKVNCMSSSEIDMRGNLTGWEASDIDKCEE